MVNNNVALSLDDAVAEVNAILTGLDLQYTPQSDRYIVLARTINRALRLTALENEWSYYSDREEVGTVRTGDQEFELVGSLRTRLMNDDAVTLCDDYGQARLWAYFLPRESLSKYATTPELRVAVTRQTIRFSRPLNASLQGLHVMVPVMREPRQFALPALGQPITEDQRQQKLDFDYPDLITARAAYIYAQTDPITQPRAMVLEDQWKNIMYALSERDTRHTDLPYLNDIVLPLEGLAGPASGGHGHPHSEYRW